MLGSQRDVNKLNFFDADEVEVHRACAFRDWNSRSGSCRNELLHQMSDTRTTAKCR